MNPTLDCILAGVTHHGLTMHMELLQAADIPCCPDNAIAEIKAVCRHILPSHNDSPIALLIREVIPSLN